MEHKIVSYEHAQILVEQLRYFDKAENRSSNDKGKYCKNIDEKISERQWFLGEELGRDVDREEATINYLNEHLPAWQVGYKDMFAKLVPVGEVRAPDYKSAEDFKKAYPNIEIEKDGNCPFMVKYSIAQWEMMNEEKGNIRDFLSRGAHHDIGEVVASKVFDENVSSEWMSGARYFIETKGCPLRSICGDSKWKAENELAAGFASVDKEDLGLISKL